MSNSNLKKGITFINLLLRWLAITSSRWLSLLWWIVAISLSLEGPWREFFTNHHIHQPVAEVAGRYNLGMA